MDLPKFRKQIVQLKKNSLTDDRKVRAVFSTDYWHKNALFDFIVAYRVEHKSDPTFTSLKYSRLVPEEKLQGIIDELVEHKWVTTWSNGYTHYAPVMVE